VSRKECRNKEKNKEARERTTSGQRILLSSQSPLEGLKGEDKL
jgi:hypothetical protein